MSEPNEPTGERPGSRGLPYAELGGLNEAIARRRREETPADPVAPPAAGASPALAETPRTPPPATPRPPVIPEAAGGASSGGSSAGVWLSGVAALIVGAIGALWAAPHLAPYAPQPVADFLTIRGTTARAEIAEIREAFETLSDEVEAAGAGREALDAVADFSDRIDAFAGRVRTEDDPSNAALAERLATLRGAVDAAAPSEAVAALEDRLDEIAGSVEALSALSDRIDALEEAQAETASAAALSALEERLAMLENAEPAATAAERDALAGRIEALETADPEMRETIGTLAGRVAPLEKAAPGLREGLDALAERLGDLESAPEAATAEAFGALAARVQDMQAAMAAAESRAAEAERAREAAEARAAEQARMVRLRSEAENLREAVRNGTPFVKTLTALTQTAGTAPPRALAETAEAGVASTGALLARFQSAARRALRATATTNAEADDAFDQLGAWLQSQVATRPTEAVEGNDPAAVLSRVEAALDGDDPVRALSEAEALPEPARAAMDDWLADLRTRVETERALEEYLGTIGAGQQG